ncbi:MAG TPA: hypothetical protein VFW27_08620 [Actinoplanes sp.]|jgi:hypothetical protein|nr:hypothetical protein [Actinoplanes sp.]
MADGDGLTLGSVNMSTQQTHLQRDGAPLIAFSVANLDGDGIIGASTSDGIGVQGTSDSGTGLRGATNTGDGVVGITQGGEESAGVRGTAQIGRAAGVVGEAESGSGVLGLSDLHGVTGATPGGIGVLGYSGHSTGVYGQSDGPDDFNSAGVRGVSVYGNGVIGSSAEGWAGLFVGPVFVDGDLAVSGSIGTAAAGRVMPAEWIGRADLVDGHAVVGLEPGGAARFGTEYHVFVTPEADCAGLYVSARREDAFEVRELRRGRSSVAFSYRVVAPSADRPARRAIPRTTPAVAAEGRPPDPAEGMGAVLADRLRQRGAGRG